MTNEIMLPSSITFTGVDEQTDVCAMLDLVELYPIEWGVLFSPSRQGNDQRYPSLPWIQEFVLKHGAGKLSAHLCGGYTMAVMDGHALPNEIDQLVSTQFDRVQFNGASRMAENRIKEWSNARGLEPIMQCPEKFPEYGGVGIAWLLDGSGGKGIKRGKWPYPRTGLRVGFAGGLGPDNVEETVERVGNFGCIYWLDMESGVRDANNRFSLEKCQAVCEIVYGKR